MSDPTFDNFDDVSEGSFQSNPRSERRWQFYESPSQPTDGEPRPPGTEPPTEPPWMPYDEDGEDDVEPPRTATPPSQQRTPEQRDRASPQPSQSSADSLRGSYRRQRRRHSRTPSSTHDVVDLSNQLDELFRSQAPEDFHSIARLCNDAVSLAFDSCLQFFTNFTLLENNGRRGDVDRMLERNEISSVLLNKFEVLARLATFPEAPESLLQLEHNFHFLVAGFINLKNFLAPMNTKIIELYDNPHQLPEPAVDQFYNNMFFKLKFLQQVSHTIAGLMARFSDQQVVDGLISQWNGLEIQIKNLKIGGGAQLASARLRAHHQKPNDTKLIYDISKAQFNAVAEIEEKLEKVAGDYSTFQSEFASTSRAGLKQTSKASKTASSLTKYVPAIFEVISRSNFNRPRESEHSDLARMILKSPGFEINFARVPINPNSIQQQLDLLVAFSKRLGELCEVLPKTSKSEVLSPVHQQSEEHPSSGQNSIKVTESYAEIILAECRQYANELETAIGECGLFNNAEPDKEQANIKLATDLQSSKDNVIDALKNLKIASRSDTIELKDRTQCKREIRIMEDLVRQSNIKTAQYHKLDRTVKSQLENKNKLFLKSHQAMKILFWPPQNKSGARSSAADINQSFLNFISEVLQGTCSPFMTNRDMMKKLTDHLSNPEIRQAVESMGTFPLAIGFLLKEFRPEKSSILSITRTISRIGSRNGPATLIEEYQNLLKLHKTKMVALKAHHLLLILENCEDSSASQLQEIGTKLKNPEFLDQLIQNFSEFHHLDVSAIDDKPPSNPKEVIVLKRRSQIQILLSYHISKDDLEKFVRRSLTSQSQVDYHRTARNLKVNMNSQVEYQGYFWHFVENQKLLLSQTSAGLKHQLEVNNSTADSRNKHSNRFANNNIQTNSSTDSDSSSAHDSDSSQPQVFWTKTNTKPKDKQKDKRKAKGKKNSTFKQNTFASNTEYKPFVCPLDPQEQHRQHRPWQCPNIVGRPTDSTIKMVVKKGICPACLNKSLDQHSLSCQPTINSNEGGVRKLVPLYCKRCSKVDVPSIKISSLVNRKICRCAQKEAKKGNSKQTPQFYATSPTTSKSSRDKNKKPTKRSKKPHKVNSTSEVELEEIFTSHDEESECNTPINFAEQQPVESDSSESTNLEEVEDELSSAYSIWHQQELKASDSSDNEEQEQNTNSAEESDNFQGWFSITEESNPTMNQISNEETEIDNFSINKINCPESHLSAMQSNSDKVPVFSLEKLHKSLAYVNIPSYRSYLLSESVTFIGRSGVFITKKAIWDSGAQRSCINLARIESDFYLQFAAQFSIQTVSGSEKISDGCKADFVLTNSPTQNASPKFYKIQALGLKFDQKFATPDLTLDSETKHLLQVSRDRISKFKYHHLSIILGADTIPVWPREVLRNNNYSIFRSTINPQKLLAFGTFHHNIKEKTAKNLKKLSVQLTLFTDLEQNTCYSSAEIETNVALLDEQVHFVFHPGNSLQEGHQPLVADGPSHSDEKTAPLTLPQKPSTLLIGCPSSPVLAERIIDEILLNLPDSHQIYDVSMPDLEMSETDDSQSTASYTDISESQTSQTCSENTHFPIHSKSSSKISSSLPTCSTNFSNCINDEKKAKLASKLARIRLSLELGLETEDRTKIWIDNLPKEKPCHPLVWPDLQGRENVPNEACEGLTPEPAHSAART